MQQGLGEFLPEAEPEQIPIVPLRPADLDQLDALLVAMSSRLHTLDADLDQLRSLSVKAGQEYHRLSDQARVLRLRAAPVPPRLPAPALTEFEVAQSPAAIESTAVVARVALPATARAQVFLTALSRLPARLRRLRPAAVPIAGVLVGFLVVPALLFMRGTTSGAGASAAQAVGSSTPVAAAAVRPAPRATLGPVAAPATPPVASPAILVTSTHTAPVTPVQPASAAPQPTGPAERSVTAPVQAARSEAAGTRAGFEGTLQVQSLPAGASVFVNQQYVGVTPLMVPRVRAGSSVVWVERSGYERWTGGVLVPTGAVKTLLVNLTKASEQRH